MRDRLIELSNEAHIEWLKKQYDHETDKEIGEYVADYLLAEGVIVPPVKVRQTIYALWMGGRKGKGIAEFQVISINLDTPDDVEIVYRSKKLNATMCRYANASDIGKTLFLSRVEAEQALEREMARGYEKSSC